MSTAEQPRRALPNGLWGVALLAATEATLFGTIIASYFYLRFQTTQWPPAGIAPPAVALPLALTGALVLTSVPMALAARAAREGRVVATRVLVLAALALQAGYLATQIVLFTKDLRDVDPRATSYGSVYIALLAVHHAHVLVGIALDAGLLARLARGLTRYRVTGVRAIALYWHFVNAIAVFVVLTQVSPAL